MDKLSTLYLLNQSVTQLVSQIFQQNSSNKTYDLKRKYKIKITKEDKRK